MGYFNKKGEYHGFSDDRGSYHNHIKTDCYYDSSSKYRSTSKPMTPEQKVRFELRKKLLEDLKAYMNRRELIFYRIKTLSSKCSPKGLNILDDDLEKFLNDKKNLPAKKLYEYILSEIKKPD